MLPTDLSAAVANPAAELAALRAALLDEQGRRERAEAEIVQLKAVARLSVLNPNPVLRLAADATVRFANPAAQALSAELRTIGPSMLRPRLLSATTEALRTNQSQVRELRSGGEDFMLYAVPIQEENCALLYLVNITAQRTAEQQLQEQQELHQLMLRHLPASVSVLDADQRCRYHNAHDSAGPDRSDWRIGHTFGEFCMNYGLPFTLATRRRRLFERSVQTRSAVEWEEQWPAQSGGQQPTYWLRSYQPVFGPDGQLRLMMSYGLDITRRREAEEATRQSEAAVLAQQAFTSQVLDTCPNVIFVRDSQGRNVFSNAAMRELTALDEQREAADPSREGIIWQEKRIYADADAQVLKTGQRITTDAPFTLASGEMRWYQTIRQPLRPLGGGTAQVLGVGTDITALKRAQQAAEAAAIARENFLANMSHEIRTPLNGVLGMAGLLSGTALNTEQQHYLGVIRNSGRNLLAVLNDVLDMAKITSGKLELERIAFDLTSALHTAAETLAFRATEKGLTFELKLPTALKRPLWVSGDPYRLTQVILNLLSNAIKFTREGGVMLEVQVLRRTRQRLRLRLLVKDTGPGIAPERQEAVFDSFAQAYASTTREHGGTGLGLSISRGLVEQLTGSPLLICSEEGQGSTFGFTLSLPRTAAPVAAAPGSLSASATMRGRRVLLVEDNAVNRELARLLLLRNAVRVDEAVSGTEALACFDEHRYDAVLMDIQMPGMSGLEATAHMRRHPDPERAATPIIALTANAFRADAERYRAAGLDDTLAKPFEENELLEKLAAVLRQPDLATGALPVQTCQPATTTNPAPDSLFLTEPSAETDVLYDLKLLRETARGSTAFINKILTAFQANTPTSIAELAAARTAADWLTVSSIAHRLRPSLTLLGSSLLPVLATLETEDMPDVTRAAAAQVFEQGLTELLQALPASVAAVSQEAV
jgi:PAS domain S-box-containing protein